MPTEGLRELYVDQLKDLYNAENQLVKALPKMAKASSSEELPRAPFYLGRRFLRISTAITRTTGI